MTMNSAPSPGFNQVGSYQVSGLPWVISKSASLTADHLPLPYVSKWIKIVNMGSGSQTLQVGFTANGLAGSNYYSVLPNTEITLDIRIKDVWIKSTVGTPSYSMIAGLTPIEARQMPTLTGSLTSGSLGWPGVG